MEQYWVTGGRRLEGTAVLPAAKNSVLPILAASVACRGPVELRQAPRIADVRTSVELLRALGLAVRWRGGSLRVTPAEQPGWVLPAKQAAAMRSSVFYLAPLLQAAGRVTLPLPGGCKLGPRPIDIHLDGLARMGAKIAWQRQTITLSRRAALHGVDYTLRLPSVGATETLLMAASLARGRTVLRGVACEPEVQDLAAFLTACGARIQGAGGPVIWVDGVEELHGCTYTPLPDRIIGGTLACAVACAGGRVCLQNANAAHMQDLLALLARAGCGVRRDGAGVWVERDGPLRGVGRVITGAWPGFATDAAPLAAAAMLTARGESVFYDTLFEKRFACARGFAALGGRATVQGRALEICGVEQLHAAAVDAPDLRGGAALVLAALGASGVSVVRDRGHIRRGYPDLAGALCALGAEVRGTARERK